MRAPFIGELPSAPEPVGRVPSPVFTFSTEDPSGTAFRASGLKAPDGEAAGGRCKGCMVGSAPLEPSRTGDPWVLVPDTARPSPSLVKGNLEIANFQLCIHMQVSMAYGLLRRRSSVRLGCGGTGGTGPAPISETCNLAQLADGRRDETKQHAQLRHKPHIQPRQRAHRHRRSHHGQPRPKHLAPKLMTRC